MPGLDPRDTPVVPARGTPDGELCQCGLPDQPHHDGVRVLHPYEPRWLIAAQATSCPVCRHLVARHESRPDGVRYWHLGPHILGDTPCWDPR